MPPSSDLRRPAFWSACREIAAGDELALTSDEAASLAARPLASRRASGAARIVARDLLARLGHHDVSLPARALEGPRWPAGIVGSLAHDASTAIAAVAAPNRRR